MRKYILLYDVKVPDYFLFWGVVGGSIGRRPFAKGFTTQFAYETFHDQLSTFPLPIDGILKCGQIRKPLSLLAETKTNL
jgi:hypothetical protein